MWTSFRQQSWEPLSRAVAGENGADGGAGVGTRAAPATIIAEHTTAEDAINLLLRTNQLEKKVLNERSLLIYPARPE